MVVTLLFLGGSQDVIAGTLGMSLTAVTQLLQLLVLVAPPIAWYVTWRLCRVLAERPGPERTERSAPIYRDSGGGYRSGPLIETLQESDDHDGHEHLPADATGRST